MDGARGPFAANPAGQAKKAGVKYFLFFFWQQPAFTVTEKRK